MSKNVKHNDDTYSNVSEIEVPVVGGGTAKFKDEDEIVTPSGTKQITANGNGIDVTNYAAVDVNVQGGGDTPTLQDKTVTENGTYSADSGYDGLGEVVVNVSGGGGALVAFGSHTYIEDSTESVVMPHGLGGTPDFVYIISSKTGEVATKSVYRGGFYATVGGYATRLGAYRKTSGSEQWEKSASGYFSIDETNITLLSSTYHWEAGATVYWIAFKVIEDE